jgi:hypothetical protein
MSSLQRVKIFAAAALAVTTAVAAPQPPAGQIPCYADMAQDYEWETRGGKVEEAGGGVMGFLAGCPGYPALAKEWSKIGGHVQIRLRGQEITATWEQYWWGMQGDNATGACTGVKKFTTKSTHVVKNGVEYDLTIETDKPPERSTQKAEDIGDALHVPNDPHQTGVPSPGDPYLEILGTETIAGHVCTKFSARADKMPPGSAHFTWCEVDVAPRCVLAHLIEPLELIVTAPDGTEMTHGRTTLLQFGSLGQVVPADAITPP